MYRASLLKELLIGRRILIAGYGREGKSTHALLQHLLPEQPVDIAQNDEEIVAALRRSDYDLIIKSPGIPTFRFEGLCNLDKITSQTDLFLRVCGDQTVAVTGTKGKSTTTTLIYEALKYAHKNVVLAGNIGIPLFGILPSLDEQSVVVAEFSCHQLENIHRAPHISVLLNLFQEHLDHYHSYLDYQLAKLNIGLRQQPGDVFFYCKDNAELAALVEKNRAEFAGEVVGYSLSDAQEDLRSIRTTLLGDHNLSNIVVANLVSQRMGVDKASFASVIENFHGLEHRLEFVGTYGGITFYNDSISTIPEATEAAVSALGNVDTLILGGFDRGIDYSGLATFLASSAVRNIAFVGQAGRRVFSELSQIATPQNYLMEDDYAKIVDWCFAHTEEGKSCLLSPAAASYDAFKNFEERGRIFKELVQTH